jgi:aspartate aminotransferase-like enzyme
MGNIGAGEVVTVLAAIEGSLRALGVLVNPGAAVAAASSMLSGK